jgi:poly(3-hydroxybutyrate) depolymerase
MVVKDFGQFTGVSRDLRESPYFLDLDLADVADGNYQLHVEVVAATQVIGASDLLITVRQGLNALVAKLEQGASSAPAEIRADILYPVDRMRQVNRGKLELRTFNPAEDFAAAEAVLTASAAGTNPFVGRSGDFKRHYLLESANEIMPYRMYVPSSYDPSRGAPLIVALHGLGGTENSFFENYEADFPRLAEQHGYIVAAPLGFRVDGSYGWGLGNAPVDPTVQFVQARSEEDVMQVLELARAHYNIDPDRIYLAGHSMGAIGTWKVAAKFPEVWAAIGMFAGAGTPATLSQMQHIPQYVVHGDADPTVSVEGSRPMVARMKELEMTVQYTEVPGGNHGDVVAPGFPGLFEFFNSYTKK